MFIKLKQLFIGVLFLLVLKTANANHPEKLVQIDATYHSVNLIPENVPASEAALKLNTVIKNYLNSLTGDSTLNGKENGRTSINSILNADGTIKPGIDGSFDATGFNMHYAQDGAPVFSSGTNAGCDQWDSKFNMAGLNSSVDAIAVSGNNIYIGGNFSYAGGIIANGIAVWNGNNWSALGSGVYVTGNVLAIAISGDNVYVGGKFSTAGGIVVNNIAMWNGTNWAALGSGVNNGSIYNYPVQAIAISGQNIYVGGNFTMAGNKAANHVAVWDGSSWNALGTGVDGLVKAIAIDGNNVYAGGNFSTVGGAGINAIAMWNGNSWNALGSGISFGSVNVIAISGGKVYVGGYIIFAGGLSANHIAAWNGSNWSTLGSGLNGYVNDIEIIGNKVYVAGSFTTAGGNPANNVAVWNGIAWSPLGDGIKSAPYEPGIGTDEVSAIAIDGSNVYAGGDYTRTNGNVGNYFTLWNGASWNPIDPVTTTSGHGVDAPVMSVVVSGDKIYVGGLFTEAGNITANRVAVWNGNNWSAMGSGIVGTVNVMAVNGNHVYVGGSFISAGGIPAKNIAVWNGSNWSALGNGVSGSVYALAFSGTNLYAGGGISSAGDVPANYIAMWNGSNWSSLGDGVNGGVRAIAANGSNVYVGGYFNTAGGVPAKSIAMWNGSNWSALGNGVDGYIHSIALNSDKVYAGGGFSMAGDQPASNIAVWNGSNWSALGNGVDGSINSIALNNNKVYVGGDFRMVDNNYTNSIKVWNGNAWTTLGGDIDRVVYSLALTGNNICIGGSFNFTGKIANNIANSFNIFNSCIALPVSLLNFNGSITGSKTHLSWQTTNEINADNILVEKSVDGIRFTVIGSVAAQGNVPVSSYSFTDLVPGNGRNLYRLKIMDKDGSFTYSKVISLDYYDNKALFKIFPNPASTTVRLDFNQSINSLQVKIVDKQGRHLLSEDFNGISGTSFKLEVATLAPGTYIVNVDTNVGSYNTQLIILK